MKPTVAKKFAGLLALFPLLQFVQLALGLSRLARQAEEAQQLGTISRLRPAILAELAAGALAAAPGHGREPRQRLLAELEKQDEVYRDLAARYAESAAGREDEELVRSVREAIGAWEKELEPLLRSIASASPPAARAALERYQSLFPVQAGRLARIGALLERRLHAQRYRALRDYVAVFVLSLLFALLAAWVVRRDLVLRLHALAQATQAVAAGDLGARVPAAARDELGDLAQAFNAMAASLDRHAARLAALHRVYLMTSRINAALVRLRERAALLREACRIAVEAGGFRLAWIGFPDPQSGEIRPAAQAGEATGYPDDLRIALEPDVPEGQGPAATAFRTAATQVCNDIEHDPRMAPWRSRALASGLRSVIVLPLRIEGRTAGIFALYASQSGAFDREEVRLLEELAADVALGLEHIELAQELSQLANYDTLTGLPNRSLFADRLTQALARARHARRALAVLVARLENLHQVSSVLGRHVGDALLQELGAYLRLALRRPGDTVARLSGANFGVLLVDLAQPEDIPFVVNRLLDGLPETFVIGEEKVVPALRMGVAVYPTDGEDGETLLRNAELAMLQATEDPDAAAGRLAFYSAEQGAQAAKRLRLEQALHAALERGEFALHYQPVVELATGRIVGLEALARWTNPALGAVPPDRFVPLAEDNGLILPIGEWALETACRQAMRWAPAGFAGLRVAVNVSARQLREAGFAERVHAVLQKTRFDVRQARLALEITESELMHDPEQAVAVLKRLKALGLLIYVDDFGTGYSSLSYLRRLPVDVLKIDQSFVRDLGQAAEGLAVAKAILALAAALGLEVVAEGIETPQQRAILLEIGCRLGQGYLFGRPQPAEKIEALLQADRAEKR